MADSADSKNESHTMARPREHEEGDDKVEDGGRRLLRLWLKPMEEELRALIGSDRADLRLNKVCLLHDELTAGEFTANVRHLLDLATVEHAIVRERRQDSQQAAGS